MKYLSGILLLLLVVLITYCGQSDQHSASQPNILIMVADDMGYGDLGCYGGLSATPHIDQLADRGWRFTDFYAAAPNCSPSRVGLLTGRSPMRTGMYNYRPSGHPMHLQDEEVTIAEVLKQHNYQTMHAGKWHLGCLPQDSTLNHPQPKDQGFDHSLGTENNTQPSHKDPVNFVRNGKRLGKLDGYACQIVADEAIDWLESQKDPHRPFFMYLAFHEPHRKVASPPDLVAKYGDHPKLDAEYLANIENLDLAVGRIMTYLRESNQYQNTLTVISSDNGSYRETSNGGLRAVKSYVYEGGIRVPGIMHWPELSSNGKEIAEPAGFVDMMPTIMDVVNIRDTKTPSLDGQSILPLLKGEELSRSKPLFWFFYRSSPEIAMRMDNYMVLGIDHDTVPRPHQFSSIDMTYIKQMALSNFELYDLSEDLTQRNNLILSNEHASAYQAALSQKLAEIQSEGHEWSDLPPAQQRRKVKTDWVPYDRISKE